MRVKAIWLSWFRGAADTVSLEPNCKSMVVYGENGSGKSSFVDAVEYVLRGGRIGHLSHEYSGKHQEKAVINTHRPEGRNAEVGMTFQDGAELHTEIKQNGSFTIKGTKGVDLSTILSAISSSELAPKAALRFDSTSLRKRLVSSTCSIDLASCRRFSAATSIWPRPSSGNRAEYLSPLVC